MLFKIHAFKRLSIPPKCFDPLQERKVAASLYTFSLALFLDTGVSMSSGFKKLIGQCIPACMHVLRAHKPTITLCCYIAFLVKGKRRM